MITKEHINEMEERVTRMFPYIDLTAVNILRAEIKNLKELLDRPVTTGTKPLEETVVIEEKLATKRKSKVEPTTPTE